MIGLLIQDNQYEQGIRELLMSLHPDEAYAHEVEGGLDFYAETRPGDNAVSVSIWEDEATPESWKLSDSRIYPSDLSDHSTIKNIIKKVFYLMLAARMGRETPQDSLTSIRPIRIALTRLEEGWKEEDTRSFIKKTCLASDEEIDLSTKITAKEKKLLEPLGYERGCSLCVGIPSCPAICLCCFSTSYPIEKWKGRTGLYLEVLSKELECTTRKMKGRPLDTVYLGGDTPAFLPTEDLGVLLSRLEQLFDLSRVLEFTVEAGRPSSITPDRLKVLRDHSITRISINPQTMNQKTLDLIRRHHAVKVMKERFYTTRGLGFDNINMDLTMGFPEENMDDVQRALEEVRALGPDSLMVHLLTIKRTARFSMFKEEYDRLKVQNALEMIELSTACASEMDMEPYYLYCWKNMTGSFENVGYPLPGKTYTYNILTTEEMQTIAACGVGATIKVVFPSENRRERCENVKEVEQYTSRVNGMIQRKERTLQL